MNCGAISAAGIAHNYRSNFVVREAAFLRRPTITATVDHPNIISGLGFPPM